MVCIIAGYLARATLNSGSAMEIDGAKTPIDILLGAMVPDYNHDCKIDQTDRDRVELGDKYYFWVNDDDGSGDTDGKGIPGTRNPATIGVVNGTRDLVDYFPVQLDISDLTSIFAPGAYTYRLKNADGALSFVLPLLSSGESGKYLTDVPTALILANAPALPITATGLDLDSTMLQALTGGKDVVLLEAWKATKNPLVLEVYSGATLVYSQKLNLSIDGVEQMFRHKNLISVVRNNTGPTPATGSTSGGEPDRPGPMDFDKECNDKNIVFLHGYNVDGQEARGWQAETFKRLYWSGSKAKFWAITWNGAQTKLGLTFDYHVNVVNAFETAPALKNFLSSNVIGDISIMAHSLGNMVVSSMLSDNYSFWDSNNMAAHPTARINNYIMVDAAVALEAYDGAAATSLDMSDSAWYGYKPSLWSTEWYRLFQMPDSRAQLTWRDRFMKRPVLTNYFNFYSTGEEVLAANPYGTPLSTSVWNLLFPLGKGTWALQEKLKGSYPGIDIVGNSLGGWGFNCVDKEYCIGGVKPIASTDANNLDEGVLKTKPFFRKGPDSDLYEPGNIGSTYAFNNMNHLLAQAVPALTLPAGANEIKIFTGNNINFDMQDKSFKNKNQDWPNNRGLDNKWRHSDIRDIAYPYIYNLFNKFVSQGGLNQ